MKIAFFEIKKWEKTILKKKLKGHTLEFFEEPISLQNISTVKNFDIISVFIYSKVDKSILAKMKKLKMISTRSTGFDHIALRECKKRKIIVSNVPFYGENTVAEHTFALMLSLSRNVHKSYLRTQKSDFSIEGLKGFDLKGKTLGIIGAGRIGLHVIRMAKSFGMNVIAFDTKEDNFLADVLGFEYKTFEEVLGGSDIISLHAPHNKYTHHLINKDSIKKIKKGAILINTARGALIDIDALIEALDKKIIAGAGLDVMEGEELIKEENQLLHSVDFDKKLSILAKDHILIGRENVVFTPHIGFYSQEALERIIYTSIDNITGFIGNQPLNIVEK